MSKSTKSESLNPQNLDFLQIQYQVLSERRINHNSLLWNVPSLLFVAQTFIWTLALDGKIPALLRCIISFLSILVAIISFQLFERHRLMEIIDSAQMYSVEKYIENQNCKKKNYAVMIIHHRLDKRTLIDGRYETVSDFINNHPYYKKHNQKSSFCQLSSARLWKVIFITMIILSCLIFLYAIWDGFLCA